MTPLWFVRSVSEWWCVYVCVVGDSLAPTYLNKSNSPLFSPHAELLSPCYPY